ncbi:MAG: family 16 glycosylhydrolase [Paludibacteraceae bacterium]|nr:family 16 glycosylhydrolase [Paludibacteraceae bacterium]
MKKRLLSFATACLTAVQAFAAYQLVWSDEFNGTSLNTDVWNYELGVGSNCDGNGNWERQEYVNDANNIYVSDGNLVIKATYTDHTYNNNGCSYSAYWKSGRINTKNKVKVRYGKIEARIKLPEMSTGVFPAFWMLGSNYDGANMNGESNVGWPRCGEIDIMEQMGSNMSNGGRITPTTLHWYSNGNADYGGSLDVYGRFGTMPANAYFIYGIEWTPDNISGYVCDGNGNNYTVVPNRNGGTGYGCPDAMKKDFFLLLNLAMGGTAVDEYPDAYSTATPTMYVDWVRIYPDDSRNDNYLSAVEGNTPDPIEVPVAPDKNASHTPSADVFVNGTATNITNVNPNWAQSGAAAVDNTVKAIHVTNMNYQGLETNALNASTYNKLHIDVFAQNSGTIRISIINTAQAGGTGESAYTLSVTGGSWNQLDIPLTSFTATVNGGAVLNNIDQFKFDNASLSDFYYANLYFYDAANTQPDTEDPSTPANLTANAAANSIGLTWTASTDNIGVTGYNIYVNGTKVGSSNTTSYTVTGLQPETSYQIAVEAYDAAGNTSNRVTRTVTTTEGASMPCHNTFSTITASRNVVNYNGNWNQINGLHTVNGNSVTVNVGNANYANLYVVLSGDDQALTAGTTYVFTGRLTATKASTVKIYIESRDNNQAQHLFDNNPITLQANTPVDFSFEATNPQALTNPDMTISIDNGPTNTTYTLTDISIREKTCATNVEEMVESGNLNGNLTIYPNPAREKAIVVSDKEVASVALFSLTGAQVATFDSAIIDLTGVDKGFYLVVVTYTDGTYGQSKLICR